MTRTKEIYYFSKGYADGDVGMHEVLGGKGAGLAEMAKFGMPVPPGFTIPVTWWQEVLNGGISVELKDLIEKAMAWLEETSGRTFGHGENSLFVAVRSGARVFMPGQMDTVLNIGLTNTTFPAMVRMVGLDHALQMKNQLNSTLGYSTLSAEEQLMKAVLKIFRSWNNDRARHYRQAKAIPDDWGTPCTIQAMVFGNAGKNSGTGIVFSHNLKTGQPGFNGEWLVGEQGEAIVSGAKTPSSITTLKSEMPEVAKELEHSVALLYERWHHPVDCEFTVEEGKLWILQAMRAHLAPAAVVTVAVAQAVAREITEIEAIRRVNPAILGAMAVTQFASDFTPPFAIAKGLPSSSGVGSGRVVFSSIRATQRVLDGDPLVLVAIETSPSDMAGFIASSAVLTARGGYSSHAAIVMRNLGKPGVVGCQDLIVNGDHCVIREQRFNEGDWITVDGNTGKVYAGKLPLIKSSDVSTDVAQILTWADTVASLTTWGFGNSTHEVEQVVKSGGAPLLLTENMFLGPENLLLLQQVLLANATDPAYQKAIEQLAAIQLQGFREIFAAAEPAGQIIVRLLDPPLFEFLAPERVNVASLSLLLHMPFAEVAKRIAMWKETNPLIGSRGVRVGVMRPDLYQLQLKAMAEALQDSMLVLKLLIPMVTDAAEICYVRRMVEEISTFAPLVDRVQIGSMVETPRACLVADELATVADWLLIGTSDLTQTTWASSRVDTGFVPAYLRTGIWKAEPSSLFDARGVGRLSEWTVQSARRVKPSIPFIIGLYVGQEMLDWWHRLLQGKNGGILGSPPQVPEIRLAVAHATLTKE